MELMFVSDTAGAFILGASWAIILSVYNKISGSSEFARFGITDRSSIWIGFDILFVGIGCGLLVYLAGTYFSSFRYGLAGLVVGNIVYAIERKLR